MATTQSSSLLTTDQNVLNNHTDRSMELFREIMLNGENGERDFKELVEEFIQLIETKLSDTEVQMFDNTSTRTASPSLFDMLNDLKTCLTLLRRTEIQSLLNVFDNVLKIHCYPSALPEPDTTTTNNNNNENQNQTTKDFNKLSEYAIDQLKIVEIEKHHQPLGLTISRSDTGAIHIARILVGGLASTTQLFQVHDRILEINDQPITSHSLDYVCQLLSNTKGLIKFLLLPPLNPDTISYQTFYVRTLYTYDPYKDSLIPCKELGLAFQRGDILRIVARDENALINVSWWQAYKENSVDIKTNSLYLAGLIPSDNLQKQRTDLFQTISDNMDLYDYKATKTCFTCRSTKQRRKGLNMIYNNLAVVREMNETETPTIRTSINHFSLTDTRQFDEEKSPTILRKSSEKNNDMASNSFRFYEPVFRLDLSIQKIIRPIVLLGAPNVGRHELRRRLLQNGSNLFDIAIPHTTRARRLQELPDVDYHFVSEADFLAKVACHSFVEFGQYEQDLYGTTIDDIRYIVETKQKICILNLNPDSIRAFYKTNLYPYIICIAAPSFERLKRLELDRRDSLTDKDYREIIRQSRSIERRYFSFFDQIIINHDLERTYIELHDLILRIQHDQQQWIRTCYKN